MDKLLGIFCGGVIVGIVASIISLGETDGAKQLVAYKEMVDQCELLLPRSDKCVMIAVPKQVSTLK